MIIHSKLPHISTTIFTRMSQLALEAGAINLGQGFPGFESDPALFALVNKYMSKGFNQYAPMSGVADLNKRISEKIEKLYGCNYSPITEVTITAGATQAIFTAITAFVHDEDEVILFAPAYDCYSPAIEVNGGRPVWVNLHYPDYKVNWDEVKKLVNHRTRMIIINSPHNPCGACFGKSDMLELQKIVSGTDIIVLSDEVYEHMVFDGQQHESVCRYPTLRERSLAVYSFGKTFHNTGWKMGYIVGPELMMREFRKVHQFNVFSCNTPIQHALAEYMEDENTYLGLSEFYQKKRDFFLSAISSSRFMLKPSSGTYFQVLSYQNISNEKDTDLAIRLTQENKIASIPCSVFYPEHLDERTLRFCFAKDESTLTQAAELLCRI